MPRRPEYDRNRMSPFARWIYDNKEKFHLSIQEVADRIGIDKSQIYKVLKSYEPRYASSKALGRDYIRRLGEVFSDPEGGFVAAGLDYAPPRAFEISPNETLNSYEREIIATYRKMSALERQHWLDIGIILMKKTK